MEREGTQSSARKFYLKVAYADKIKKYCVQNPSQIKFRQIREAFGLDSAWKDSFYHFEIVNLKQPHIQSDCLSEQQLVETLSGLQINSGQNIKVKIVEKQLLSEEERLRKDSKEELEIPTAVCKKRSRSVELNDIFEAGCQTEVFDVTSSLNVDCSINQPAGLSKAQTSNQISDSSQQNQEKSDKYGFQKNRTFLSQGNSESIHCQTQKIEIEKQHPNFLCHSLMLKNKAKSQLEEIEQRIKKRQCELRREMKVDETEMIFNILNL